PRGRLLAHSIVRPTIAQRAERGHELKLEDVLFNKFILKKIFPGGQLRPPEVVRKYAEAGGFRVTRVHALQLHYARTLDAWAANLEAARDRAIALTSREDYDTYMHYLTGCARYFRSGHLDVMQFTCCKEGTPSLNVPARSHLPIARGPLTIIPFAARPRTLAPSP